jgi:hypothetical protein
MRSNAAAGLVLAMVLVSIVHLPLAPQYLSLDNVNFAFALEQFDPWAHQPHPPGYPFFVGESRLANFFFRDARTTFAAVSVFVSALSLVVIVAVGRRMFSLWAGVAAAFLLLVNPTFWFSALESSLRPHLALFSLLTGYCCWRSWTEHESRYVLWGALALGIGSGFRPDLVFYFFPLWLLSAWLGSRRFALIIRGIGIIFGSIVLWVAILGWAVGGLDRLNLLLITYLGGHLRDTSVLLGNSLSEWMFQFWRLITWNGTGIVSWLWVIPIWLWGRDQPQTTFQQRAAFILAWVGPGLAAQALLHAEAPGHTLFSVPVFCLLGGSVLSFSFQRVPALQSRQGVFRGAALFLAVGINVFLFLSSYPIAMKIVAGSGGIFIPWRQGIADGLAQASPGNLRQLDESTRSALEEIHRLADADHCVVIVASLGSSLHYRFLNSRIASYYFPDQEIWIVADEESAPRATLIKGKNLLDIRYGPTIDISIPGDSRVVWLTDANGPLRTALGAMAAPSQIPSVLYTDFAPASAPLQVTSFRFIPNRPPCKPGFAS